MRTITYTESPNGVQYLASEGKQMDIIEPISSENVINKIKAATSESEITRILHDAREAME